MGNVYFLHQIKHTKSTDVWDKGIVVKATDDDNLESVLQSYHAYLGAYAYGHDSNTDYVQCIITSDNGNRIKWELWDKRYEPEPEPEDGVE
jgi:hypothetical protein